MGRYLYVPPRTNPCLFEMQYIFSNEFPRRISVSGNCPNNVEMSQFAQPSMQQVMYRKRGLQFSEHAGGCMRCSLRLNRP